MGSLGRVGGWGAEAPIRAFVSFCGANIPTKLVVAESAVGKMLGSTPFCYVDAMHVKKPQGSDEFLSGYDLCF